MNDYSQGALEALAWARKVLRNCESVREFRRARGEIEDSLLKLTHGAAVNFSDRAEALERY